LPQAIFFFPGKKARKPSSLPFGKGCFKCSLLLTYYLSMSPPFPQGLFLYASEGARSLIQTHPERRLHRVFAPLARIFAASVPLHSPFPPSRNLHPAGSPSIRSESLPPTPSIRSSTPEATRVGARRNPLPKLPPSPRPAPAFPDPPRRCLPTHNHPFPVVFDNFNPGHNRLPRIFFLQMLQTFFIDPASIPNTPYSKNARQPGLASKFM